MADLKVRTTHFRAAFTSPAHRLRLEHSDRSLIDRQRLARDGERPGPCLTGEIGLHLEDDGTVAGAGGSAGDADEGDIARRRPGAAARGLHRYGSRPAGGIERLRAVR